MTNRAPAVIRDHDRIIDLLNNNAEEALHIRKTIANASKAGVPLRGILSIVNTDTELPIQIDEDFLFKYFSREMENAKHYLESFLHVKIFEKIAEGDSKVIIEMAKLMGLFKKEEVDEEEMQRPIIEVPTVVSSTEDWQKLANSGEDTEEKITKVLEQHKNKKRGKQKENI